MRPLTNCQKKINGQVEKYALRICSKNMNKYIENIKFKSQIIYEKILKFCYEIKN